MYLVTKMCIIFKWALFLTLNSLNLEDLACYACPPSNPEIIGAENEFKRSVPQSFTVNVKYCEGQDELYYKWELYGHKGPNFLTYSQLFDTQPVYKFDGYRLSYSKDLVYDVEFQLKVKLSHFEDFSYPVETEKRFTLLPDEMHLEIKGGTSRTHSLSDLVLDATGSRDLSFSPSEDHFANSKIAWSSNPSLPPQVKRPNTLTWVIPVKYLKLGDVYDFSLTIRRQVFPSYPDTKTVRQRVTIVDKSDGPDFKLECVRNCLDPNPEESTLLRVSCVDNCEYVNYEWEIEPNTDEIEFGDGFDLLLVKANVFEAGKVVKFVVKSGAVARMEFQLKYMDGIKVGECDIEPKSGISGITNFKIICEGFKSSKDGVLRYNVYLNTKDDAWTLLISSPKSELKDIILSEGNPAVLKIVVRDSYFMSVEKRINVEVNSFLEFVSKEKLYFELHKLVLTKLVNPKILKVLGSSLGKNFDAVIQISSFVLDEIQRNPARDFKEEAKRDDMLKHVIESINNLDVATIPSAGQVISIVDKYFSLKKSLGVINIEPYVSQLISKCLLRASKVLYGTVSDPREIFITTTFIENMANDILKHSSNIIQEIFHKFEILAIHGDEYEYYESYEEMSSNVFLLKLSRRRILEQMVESVEELCKSLVFVHVADQKAVEFETDYIELMTLRLDPKKNLADRVIQEGDKSQIKISEELWRYFRKYLFVDFQIVILNLKKGNSLRNMNNPVGEKILTETVVLNMYGNRTQKISDLNPNFLLYLKRIEANSASEFIDGKIESQFVVHSVKVEFGQMLKLVFELPENNLKVVMKDCYPEIKDFENSDKILSKEKVFDFWPEKNGVIYIGIYSTTPISYKFSLETFSCAYWDASLDKWKKEYCSPIAITENFIICNCSHTSLFGVLQNPLAIITVSTILIIWILLLIWAIKKDKKFKKKNVAIRLKDNIPGDTFAYALIISTGIQYDGNTTSDVAFQLIGNSSDSRVHVIRKPDEDHLLQRGNDDCFLIFTPEDLGEILKIRLWHNCKGWKPHWYCDKFIIRSLQDDEIYEFDIRSWFSLVWGDGKVYREFVRVEKRSKNVKREVFMSFKDKHKWLSIWTRPAGSSFSCKERVTYGTSSLLLSMLVSAMFYGIPRRGSGHASVDPQSSYFVTWREFLIVVQTMVFTIPVNMAITFLFRNSKP